MDAINQLRAAWIASGREPNAFAACIQAPCTLHEHELYLMDTAGLTLRKEFLEICKCLLGEPVFDSILSDLKRTAIEPAAPPVRSPDGVFIFRSIEALGRQTAPRLPAARGIRIAK